MPSFPVVMRGYSRRQVAELFARIDRTLGRGSQPAEPVTAADVRAAVSERSFRGYDPRVVDEAMEKALQELEQRSG
jgi:hypothetical protein